jgi:hypothetical protein
LARQCRLAHRETAVLRWVSQAAMIDPLCCVRSGLVDVTSSGGVAILVDESTQDVDAINSPNLGQAGQCRLTVCGGYAQIDAAMGAGGVVVLHIDGEHLVELPPVPDQHPIKAHQQIAGGLGNPGPGGVGGHSGQVLRVPKTSSVLVVATLIIR